MEKNNKKPRKRYTEIGIAIGVVVVAAIIKLTTGGSKDPLIEQTTKAAAETQAAQTSAATDAGNAVKGEFDIHDLKIPEFNGSDYYIEVNNGETFFTDAEIKDEYFATLSDLDELGRAGGAVMCADEPHIQTGERSRISDLKPSGWHKGGFYERSHLLMWKLTGLNKIENLVTGTATFNEKNMQDHEKKVTRYLWDNEDNHVMYRVTPLFIGTELVCRGVLMEAYSVEDDGELEFCVFVYNAEPGALIDYATGDYLENAENMTTERPEQQTN